MSNLVEYAESELKQAGLFDGDGDYDGAVGPAVLELVTLFSAQGHSGMSAKLVRELFGKVAGFEPLGPITSDPAEWMEVGSGFWQNRRDSRFFSRDGGSSWYNVDEVSAERRRLASRRTAARLWCERILHELVEKAYPKFPRPQNSPHESYAVLLEEVDELWHEIKDRDAQPADIQAEAVQVAAMAIRLLVDCYGEPQETVLASIAQGGVAEADPYPTALFLARLFHEHYERLASDFHYETRKASAEPWDMVPEPNKSLMVATARAVLEDLRLQQSALRFVGEDLRRGVGR